MAEKADKDVPSPDKDNTSNANAAKGKEHGSDSEAVHSSLKNISEQISFLRTELKADLASFKEDFKQDMKNELTEFKHQINQQLATTTLTIQDHDKQLGEAAARIDELETWSATANTALQQSLKDQKTLMNRINDLESRSRRNNMRIYGVPEGIEGSSVQQFVEKLITDEKLIEDGTDLQIQRAHRSLALKPSPNAPPRSIVVNFLQFRVKETILKQAWQKKILLGEKNLSFDHDYTLDVVQRRKAYKHVKSTLKENGIRFQTPFTRMRIHWDSGPQVYNSAGEAEEDLRCRGFSVRRTSEEDTSGTSALRLEQTLPWQRVQRGNRGGEAAQRARERLQEFELKTVT